MDISEASNLKGKTYQLIKGHQSLFDSFFSIYLFGSILESNKTPNDIDILLVYSELTKKVLDDLEEIYLVFGEITELTFDFTVLSIGEVAETKFIRKLKSRYFRIK